MKKALFGLVCALAMSCICFADDEGDQFWAVASFSFRLSDDWNMKIREHFRFHDGEYSEQFNEAHFSHPLSTPLNLGVGFLQTNKKDSVGKWQYENRPYGELTVKWNLWGLKWSDRNRLVFRDFKGKKDIFRYRNRVKAAWGEDVFDLPLRPYVAEEVFIEEESGYNQNRISAGVVWDVNKLLDIDVFVMHRSDKKDSDWDDVFVIGIETIFSF